MRPIPITEYLDRISRSSSTETSSAQPAFLRVLPKQEASPPAPPEAAPKRPSQLFSAHARPRANPVTDPISVPQSTDVQARIEEALLRGREEGRAATLAEAQARVEEERRAMDEEALASRLDFQASEYARFSDQLLTAFASLEERISSRVACILTPFLDQLHREQVLAALSATLAQMGSANSTALVSIEGPKELLEILAERTKSMALKIEFTDQPTVDVRVVAGDTEIETQLNAWKDLFAEALN